MSFPVFIQIYISCSCNSFFECSVCLYCISKAAGKCIKGKERWRIISAEQSLYGGNIALICFVHIQMSFACVRKGTKLSHAEANDL